MCSESISDKGEESCSDESENSSKENQTDIKHSRNHSYRKESNSQIPPLPVLHPHHLSKNLLPTSFPDVSSTEKADCNLISTSFNIPSNTLTTSFNHSSHLSLLNTFFASTSFNKPLYKTHMNPVSTSTVTSTNSSQSFNISDGLMTTSFGSLSINERKATASSRLAENSIDATMNKSVLNEIQYSLDSVSDTTITANLTQDNSFMSTPFNNPTHDSIDVSSDLLKSSLNNMDSNIMSTSFSTLGTSIQNPYDCSLSNLVTSKSESIISSPSLKNTKSPGINDFAPKTFSDSVTTNKSSSFHSSHSNLVSTSFNFLQNHVQDPRNSSSKGFNNEQSLTGKKQVDFNVPPPPPSLTNSFTNYLQNLPRKNLPISRSTSGLADIDESIQKLSSIKTRNVTSHLLQKQNSTSNILQAQQKYNSIKPSRYRLNYDLDYISFHGSCDNINIHSTTNNTKLGTSQFSSTYNMQSRFDNRHSKILSPQNSTNINVSKEIKVSSNVPPLPIISTPTSNSISCSPFSTFVDTTITNDKPKVKFSDTVTHILVPGTVSILICEILVFKYIK